MVGPKDRGVIVTGDSGHEVRKIKKAEHGREHCQKHERRGKRSSRFFPKQPQRNKQNERTVCRGVRDRKSTRLNSSHSQISYAVFCLKKKNHSEIGEKSTEFCPS